jgi:hypothetical protein
MGARVEWIGPELDDPDIPPPGIHGSVISRDPPDEWVVSWDNGATAVHGEEYLREVDEPERPPAKGGLLYVSRPTGRGFRRDLFRRYKVLVDDVEVASLAEGDRYIMDLVPGPHTVRAKIDWTTTTPLAFDALIAEKVKLVVRPGGGPWMTFRDMVMRSGSYLVVEREEG